MEILEGFAVIILVSCTFKRIFIQSLQKKSYTTCCLLSEMLKQKKIFVYICFLVKVLCWHKKARALLKFIKWEQICTRPDAFVISYLLFWTAFIWWTFLGWKNQLAAFLKQGGRWKFTFSEAPVFNEISMFNFFISRPPTLLFKLKVSWVITQLS